MPTSRLFIPLVAAAALAPFAIGGAQPERAARLLPAIQTDSQVARGREWYVSQCQSCHPSEDMSSADFKTRWSGQRAYDLFDIISSTMPEEEPGTLTRRTYVDIVAYLMRLNGMPATPAPLADDDASLKAATLAFSTPSNPTR
ncbi:MAG: cytochrome c [Gemmatimonadaceae bacterium]|nr:cytochrome c [Gemmatimonadaceae bacterium]MCW5827651.1 cytochrome c [Gemmatimonadaceae bacterium]